MIRYMMMVLVMSLTVDANCQGQAEPDEAARPLSIRQWLVRAQQIGASYKPERTSVESTLRFNEMVRNVEEELNGIPMKFRARVKDVQWRDGIARVFTDSELPRNVGIQRQFLQINRSEPIELRMNKSEASKVTRGDWLSFEGSLEFRARRNPRGTTSGTQQLYALRHKDFPNRFVGTFISKDFTCRVDGKRYPGRWAE